MGLLLLLVLLFLVVGGVGFAFHFLWFVAVIFLVILAVDVVFYRRR